MPGSFTVNESPNESPTNNNIFTTKVLLLSNLEFKRKGAIYLKLSIIQFCQANNIDYQITGNFVVQQNFWTALLLIRKSYFFSHLS